MHCRRRTRKRHAHMHTLAALARVECDIACMCVRYFAHDGESETGALRIRRRAKERFEYAATGLSGNAWTVVDHANGDAIGIGFH